MPKFYGEIAKTETQDDGSIKVWGYASTEAQDSDGETITAEAMKAAIPDYMKFGAVREMHNPQTAAGTALEISVDDKGKTWFGAHIIDSEAVKKVQAGVYKGFSIGGKATSRDSLNKTIITGLNLMEISLVDRPANPEAVLTCFKAAKSDSENESSDAEDDDKEDSENTEESNTEESDDKTEKSDSVAANEPLQKSLYQVKTLASLLSEVKWFCNDVEWQQSSANYPADIVADAKAAASLLASALQKLVIHETADLVNPSDNQQDTTSKNIKTDDLTKISQADDLTKALKTAGFNEHDNPADCITKMHAQIQDLLKQPEAPKASLHAISKAADTSGNNDALDGFKPITNADGSLNEAATLIKAVQAGKV